MCRTWFIYTLFVISVMLSFSCSRDHDPVTLPDVPLKIGTYNIERPSETNKKHVGYWPNRKESVAALLSKAGFDIIGTQENSREMLADMVVALPQYKWIGSFRKANPSVNAILYRHERFALLDKGHFYYSPTPGVDFSYDPDDTDKKDLNCIWGKFEDRETGVVFFVFNSHFHAFNYAGEKGAVRDTLRCRDARILKKKVASIAGDVPAFCTGDFNCGEAWYDNATGKLKHESRPGYIELIKGNELLDTRRLARKKINDREASYTGFLETGPSAHDMKIDHIFIGARAAERVEVVRYEVITDSFEMSHHGETTPEGIEPGDSFRANCSDHRPVSATILLKP